MNPPPIDRHALVERHNVVVRDCDSRLPMSLGNGEFAFNADPTGLQTLYGNTLAQWGWHSNPPIDGLQRDDLPLTPYDSYGRTVGYATKPNGQEALYSWLRENPHRLNLGRIGLRLDGVVPRADAIGDINQVLELWTGMLRSDFTLEGEPVSVTTFCHPGLDSVFIRIESRLVAVGRLAAFIAFPYGNSGQGSDGVDAADWKNPHRHSTVCVERGGNGVHLLRVLDGDVGSVRLGWDGDCHCAPHDEPHTWSVTAGPGRSILSFSAAFAPGRRRLAAPSHEAAAEACRQHWRSFWMSGGAIDLSASRDRRWFELERRIVLSQYLMAVNCAGSLPPQESGLVNSSGWHGKFHLEMHWWHGVHFALWNRWEHFSRSLDWYHAILPSAVDRARRQGYQGARWPKMTGPDGHDSPSPYGPLLLWHQPHPIYFAELARRHDPAREVLERWAPIVFSTADFLASFAKGSSMGGRPPYNLGPPVMTVPENSDPGKACNPTFELTYWRFGLRIALQWRALLGLGGEASWEEALRNLSPAPQHDGLYLQQESMLDTYDGMNWEHPSLVGALGMLPGDGIDPDIMRASIRRVMSCWQWERCWGWDFPLMAMAAARCGEPGMAVDALLHPSGKNAFSPNGFSHGGPFPYFPSNGGLLAAVAMMAAGWDGCPGTVAPGFPRDGAWTVAHEGLMPLM